MNYKSLMKRSWRPHICKETGKWYTGYDGRSNLFEELEDDHEVRTLTITPVTTARGRSAANMIFEDKDGYTYIMGLEGGMNLIRKLLKDEIQKDGEYLVADFVQSKKGTAIQIEVFDNG